MKRMLFIIPAAVVAIGGCAEQKVLAAEKTARKEVQLTIYKEDFGMVREIRPVALHAGKNQIAVEGVSNALDPRSVLFDWRRGNDLPALVANTYDVGIADGNALVKRYVGKNIEIVRYGNTGRQTESQKGRLMAAEQGGIVLQTEDSFYINPQGTIVAPAEEGIITIPRLSVVADSKGDANADLEVAYLTRGLSWTADYVGIVNPKSDTLNLQCWATVDNRAGIDFPDAKITLVAGSPNRAAEYQTMDRARVPKSESYGWTNTPALKEKWQPYAGTVLPPVEMGELQSYEVKNKSTITQSQLNRLMLLESKQVSAQKDYSVRMPGLAKWDYYDWPSDHDGRQSVTAAFTFFNREKDGLGEAMPAGAIRLYEGDGKGSVQYIGAAEIRDTPVGERINFTLSNVFNVTATNRIVSKQKNGRAITKTAEFTLRNRKDTPVTVRVVQGVSEVWTLAKESSASAKLNASTLQWKVAVPANGETKVRYTIVFR